jgi:hypothetical protein
VKRGLDFEVLDLSKKYGYGFRGLDFEAFYESKKYKISFIKPLKKHFYMNYFLYKSISI